MKKEEWGAVMDTYDGDSEKEDEKIQMYYPDDPHGPRVWQYRQAGWSPKYGKHAFHVQIYQVG